MTAYPNDVRKVAKKLLDDGLPSEVVGPLLDVTGRTIRNWFASFDGSPGTGLRTAKARAAAAPPTPPEAPPIPAGAVRHPDPKPLGHLRRQHADGQKFVITAAQNATPVHLPFLRALERYCEFNGATLIVIPYRYQNPSSMFTEGMQDQEWWAPEVAKYLCAERLQLADTLIVCADIKITATAVKPLTGLNHETGTASAIFGHPRLCIETKAVPKFADAKQLITTGACTQRNYTDTKLGARGHSGHVFGATTVRVDGSIFHHRQLDALEDGSFMDLEHEYTADSVKAFGRVAGLVMGDLHVDSVDPKVVHATFEREDSIFAVLRPEQAVGHDIIDMKSVSHHLEKSPITKIVMALLRTNDLEAETVRAFGFLDKYIKDDCLLVIADSNHQQHMDRWVSDNARDPARDPTNVLLWAHLFAESIKARLAGRPFRAFEYLGKLYLNRYATTKFLHIDEPYSIAGFRVTDHGHNGSNGAKGSSPGFADLAIPIITGHKHTPGRNGNAIVVGTNTGDMDYAQGASSWMRSDAVIYPNRKATLINIIGVDWR